MESELLVVRWAAILATTLVLQTSIAPLFPVFGVVIDLFVIISVCAGLTGGASRGAVVGFWAGMLFDAVRPGPLGTSAIAYCIVAAAAGTLQVGLLQSARLITMSIVAVASGAGTLLSAIGGELFGTHAMGHPRLWSIVGVVSLAGFVLSRAGLWAANWAEGPDTRSVAL